MLDIFADKTKIPLPVETPETAHFWAGTKAGQLCLQRCDDCQQVYFPPRPFVLPAPAGQCQFLWPVVGRRYTAT